jgi:hypothetical protein
VIAARYTVYLLWLALLPAVGAVASAEGEVCGQLVQGVECVLFETEDSIYLLSNNGGFRVGDHVCVTGMPLPDCVSSCMEGNGCFEVQTIAAAPTPTVLPAVTPTPTPEGPVSSCCDISPGETCLPSSGICSGTCTIGPPPCSPPTPCMLFPTRLGSCQVIGDECACVPLPDPTPVPGVCCQTETGTGAGCVFALTAESCEKTGVAYPMPPFACNQQTGLCEAPDSSPTPTPDWCPPTVALVPDSGPAGSVVDLTGRCYFIHSGQAADIYFDSVLVGTVRGDTPGNYHTAFTVPPDVSGGAHTVRVVTGQNEIGSATFIISPALCVGDCDADGHVTVDEILSLVGVVLAAGDLPACPAGTPPGAPVTISEIIQAVHNALNGCASN